MSVRAVAWVTTYSKSTGVDRLVFVVLAHVADTRGEAWPSIGGLAAMTRLDPKQVERSIGALEALGELEVERRDPDEPTLRLYRVPGAVS